MATSGRPTAGTILSTPSIPRLTPAAISSKNPEMEIIRGIQQLKSALPRAVLTIGNFDGVHLGHQKIIGLAIEKARARKGKAVAYTFRPHPAIALRPETQGSVPLLSTYDEKLEL